MGSWHQTCGVTHLPITAGEPVALLFLAGGNQEKHDSGLVYSNDAWTPCFLPLYGDYDDYGLIDHFSEEDWHTKHILEKVKTRLIEKEVGENKYHEPPVKKNELDGVELLLDLIRDSRVELKAVAQSEHFRDNRLGFMMVHKGIYEYLTAEAPENLWGEITTLETAIERGREVYTQVMNLDDTTMAGRMFKHLGTLKFGIGLTDEERQQDWRTFNPVKYLLEMDYGEPRLSALYSSISFRQYAEILHEKIAAKVSVDDPIVSLIIEEYCKLSIFDIKMAQLNRIYTPQVQSGQDMDYAIHLDLIEAMKRHIDEQKRQYKEMWGEDEV